MRIFVTGAPGFIGSALIPELIKAGHHVLGLTRSEAGAEKLRAVGAEVLHGNIEDLDSLREGAAKSEVSFTWPSIMTFRRCRRAVTTTAKRSR